MNLDAFLAEREPEWTELERALAASRGRPERLGAAGVGRLAELYRAAAADLALVRRRRPSDPAARRLEDLVSRARLVVYEAEARPASARSFLSHGYWRRIRERPRTLGLAVGLLVLSSALATVWAADDPAAAVGTLPHPFRGAGGTHAGPFDLRGPEEAALSVQIFTNNIQVTVLSFAAGLAAGLGTALLLLYNGLVLGVVAGLSIGSGQGSRLVELIAPHGVLELSCIAVAASAGMAVGWELVAPGPRPRSVALRREARRGVEVVIGTAPWLVIAGLVEGFVTPRRIGVVPALLVGFGLAALFWGLVAWRGAPARGEGRRRRDWS